MNMECNKNGKNDWSIPAKKEPIEMKVLQHIMLWKLEPEPEPEPQLFTLAEWSGFNIKWNTEVKK